MRACVAGITFLFLSSLGWGQGTLTVWGSVAPPVGASRVIQVDSGQDHGLALRSDGTVVGWGSNAFGQAAPPDGLSDVVQVSAGNGFSLALRADGTVQAWGNNAEGQSSVPVGLVDVIQVSAGGGHALALRANGTVVAWGSNSHGQSNVPLFLSNVIQVSAGADHSVALLTDGTLVAWGDNSSGESAVAGFSGIVSVAAGESFNVALMSNGTVAAWGLNSSGQVTVPGGLTSVIAVDAGGAHALAVLADGSVAAWGDNSAGQSSAPGAADVTSASAGGSFSVALHGGRSATGWGNNEDGQATPPTELMKQLSAGLFHSMALKPNGAVLAWGLNDDGQGTVPALGLAKSVATGHGSDTNLVLLVDGSLTGWGNNDLGVLNLVPIFNIFFKMKQVALGFDFGSSVSDFGGFINWTGLGGGGQADSTKAVSAGHVFSLALRADGTLVGTGDNPHGQLNFPPEAVNLKAVAAGGFHVLALRADGTVVAWGLNSSGQCNVPLGLSNVKAIAAGQAHSLALLANGSVVAWGNDGYGQSSVPASLANVVAIAGGGTHSLALFDAATSNEAPLAAAGDDQTVECTGATTEVTLDGSSSFDPEGDDMSYEWKDGEGNVVSTDVSPTLQLEDGTHTFSLTVSDVHGNTGTDSVTVTIQDTTSPSLESVGANPTVVWPPSGAMRDVTVSYIVSDLCDPAPEVWVTVTSSEADSGLGAGDQPNDIEVVSSSLVRVRAERFSKAGRTYTITVHARDGHGNEAQQSVQVFVPHSQAKK